MSDDPSVAEVVSDQSAAWIGTRAQSVRDHKWQVLLKRGELVERSFAHCLEIGGMRRTWLRGRANILKRYLVHVAAFNLGILMRQILGAGTPKGVSALKGLLQGLLDFLIWLVKRTDRFLTDLVAIRRLFRPWRHPRRVRRPSAGLTPSSTGC